MSDLRDKVEKNKLLRVSKSSLQLITKNPTF